MENHRAIGVKEPPRFYRWLVMPFVSLITIGSYFAYDSIGPIAPVLQEQLGIGSSEIGWMYSLYSWPNLVMVFVGGLIIDRIGTRRASFLFAFIVMLGAAVTAVAGSVATMYVGRAVFGLGSESLIVAQSTILARWFKGKELALAFGLNLTFCRLGTIAAMNSMGWIANHYSWRWCLWVATIVCLLSVLTVVVYILLDRRAEKVYQTRKDSQQDKIILSDATRFSPRFWFVTALCVTFYSAIFPFTSFAPDFFTEKWGLPLERAGFLTSLLMIGSMIFTPVFGAMVDRIGKRASLMVVGSLMLIPCHLFMGLSTLTPYVPMVVLGIAFSLVPAAMWPSLPLIVESKRLGTAYGLMTAVQNVGLALFPLLAGWLRDTTENYTATMVMFASLGIVGFMFALALKRSDMVRGNTLDHSRSDVQPE